MLPGQPGKEPYREATGKEPEIGEADPLNLLMKAFCAMEYQTMQYADAKGRMEMLKTSTGDALDALAALVGLTRKEANRATATVRFTLSEAQNGATAIPTGTRVKSEDGKYFNTVEYGEIAAGETYTDVVVQAEEAGADSNGILTGGIKILVDPIAWEMVTAYSPDIAEARYQSNLREKGPDLKIGKDHELANYIETTITERECSPAAVLGYAMLEGRTFETSVSVTTIYSYIKKGLFLHITQVDLPRRGKAKQKYRKVKTKKDQARASAGESIEQRPPEVESREEFGHWEGDTVYSGKGKCKTTSALLTLNERKTRKDIIIGIPNRKAETVVKALDALERKCGARRFRAIFKSITFDNGSEFSAAEVLERSAVNKTIPRTKVYYCHPYSSWERGSNENANSMIRRRHPKGTDFSKVSAAEIAATEEWINNYPRKILGYKSSEVMFRECLREIGLIA